MNRVENGKPKAENRPPGPPAGGKGGNPSARFSIFGFRFSILVAALITGLPLLAQDKAPAPPAKESRTAYLRRIFEKDRATYGDACRAILSTIKGEHTDADFASNVGELTGRSVVQADWGLQETSLLTKGTLAYMVCKALDLQGGATMRLFGISRRYALREVVHRRLMERGTVDEYVTGRELIDVITNVAVYQQQGHTDSQFK